MSRLRIKRIAGAVCAVIILTAGAAPFLWAGTDRVIPGVRINGTPAGGMSREELETLMHEKNEELKTDVLAVKSADGVIDEAWKFSDFSVHYKDDEIDKALKAGRDGNIAKIWYDRWHALVMGDAVHWMASYDDGALGNKVKALASEYGKPPVNAEPSFHGDGSVTFSEAALISSLTKRRSWQMQEGSCQTEQAEKQMFPSLMRRNRI